MNTEKEPVLGGIRSTLDGAAVEKFREQFQKAIDSSPAWKVPCVLGSDEVTMETAPAAVDLLSIEAKNDEFGLSKDPRDWVKRGHTPCHGKGFFMMAANEKADKDAAPQLGELKETWCTCATKRYDRARIAAAVKAKAKAK